jgi:hypothetical protein
MAYPTASGVPSLSGNYIPQLFAAKLIVEFYISTLFGAIATTEHEGEIKKMGDSLTISGLPEIMIRDYVKGQNLQYQDLDPGEVQLLIDKGKYYGFRVNDLDKVQSHIDDFASKWATHAGMLQGIEVDKDVLQNIYADAHASNQGDTAGALSGNIDLGVSGTPLSVTSSNVIQTIVNCGVVLDEQNVPFEGRWIVLPSWMIGLIKVSDIKDASITGDSVSPLRNGRVGKIDRFEVYMSNNLKNVTDGSDTVTNAIFGHNQCVAFASQLLESDMLKDQNDFGWLMRGLQAYGYEVIKPEGIGHLYCTQG